MYRWTSRLLLALLAANVLAQNPSDIAGGADIEGTAENFTVYSAG